jgi:hypothetical protein
VIVGEALTGIVPHRCQQCFDPLVVDIGDRERAGIDSAQVPGKPRGPPMASSNSGRMLELAPFLAHLSRALAAALN